MQNIDDEKQQTEMMAIGKLNMNWRQKVAVMPRSQKLTHMLRVLQDRRNIQKYKFIRTQKRNLSKALKKFENDFQVQLEMDDVPNATNILNIVKEILRENGLEYTAKYNTIRCTCDIIEIVKNVLVKN